ncbi:discoidin domain-containing protein, partial [Streptomyces sp. NPDC057798]|uniref:discoidin domain-containing protein n=1 Tax=Streptomyces sp. NPDC057798 TaxID=3346252 RepID=UPI0036C44239
MPAAGPPSRPAHRGVVAVLVLALAAALLAVLPAGRAQAAPTLLSQGKPVTASSQESAGTPATAAVDGDNGTRWSSAFSDPQWIRVDLGAPAALSQVELRWETAYATAYRIEISQNGSDWSTAYSTTTATGGTQTLNVSGTARYVRVFGTARATGWGYSLWEFKVYGTTDGGPTVPGGGDLGPNVHVFDPSTPGIQAKLDEVFRQQESAQFGNGRHAFLFKPGTYSGLNAQIGFYTQIAGLGLRPDDTTINGDITVDAGWFNGNATQNFWRAAENLAVNPVSGTNRWAVSQASSFRRMHVKGGLNLAPNGYGWASGGYIADSKIDGQVGNYSQQQWYTRDSSIGGWSNSVWNQVFSGTVGAPATAFPEPKYTTLANTPLSREKPFLYLDGSEYKVFAPALRTNARGTTWESGTPQGRSIPLRDFYVVKPGASAATINAAVAQGLHLLFTPGVYHVDQTIQINRADTIVLGLGLATIIPDNGVTAMRVGDVDGVRLAGFLIDAGPVNSNTLLEVGPQGASADHAANPTTVQDVYIRIGGAGAGKATTSMVVNSDDTIIDHTWVWRADHG